MIQFHTNEINFKGLSITHIYKKNLKNTYISVTSDSKIVLKSSSVSQEYIQKLLAQKEPWIRKQLLKQELNPPIEVNLEDEVLLFGEIYSIDTSDAKVLRDSLCRLRKPSKTNVLRCYDVFYKEFSKTYLTKRVEYYAQVMQLKYKELRFKKMKSRWGSCSSLGIITLNTNLLQLHKEQIDYVVVHELTHLVHMNHSKKFHSLVEKYFPEAQRVKKDITKRKMFTH